MTVVVNIRKEKCTVYIGRSQTSKLHYGNPFSSKTSDIAKVKCATVEESVIAFHDWLAGAAHHDIEPRRRQWILDNLEPLRGERIGCFCVPNLCHGDIYRVFLGEITLEDALNKGKPSMEAETTSSLPQMDLF